MRISRGRSLTVSGEACALAVGEIRGRGFASRFLLFDFSEHAPEHAS